jgi:hypothetical protein
MAHLIAKPFSRSDRFYSVGVHSAHFQLTACLCVLTYHIYVLTDPTGLRTILNIMLTKPAVVLTELSIMLTELSIVLTVPMCVLTESIWRL